MLEAEVVIDAQVFPVIRYYYHDLCIQLLQRKEGSV
jgi:hypothetical protein